MTDKPKTPDDGKTAKNQLKEINRHRRDLRAKKSIDEIRANFETREKDEAKEDQRRFDSDPDRVLSVNEWITEAGQAPIEYQPEALILYDQENPSAQNLERRANLQDLDELEHVKLLKAYEATKSKSIERTTRALDRLSDEYSSDMKELGSKIYQSPEKRKETLLGRYDKFKYDAQLILNQETIRMNKAAATVGLTREQVRPYTSTTEEGGIYRLPEAPQFDF